MNPVIQNKMLTYNVSFRYLKVTLNVYLICSFNFLFKINEALHKPIKNKRTESNSYLEPEITKMVQLLGPKIDRKQADSIFLCFKCSLIDY